MNQPHERTLVIAEAGVNHNGCPERAAALVEAAASARADVVKFQTFSAQRLATAAAPKATYQKETTGTGGSQLDMLRQLELSPAVFRDLRDQCQRLGIEFLSTPFDQDSLRILVEEIGVGRLKLGSGEITNAPFLLAAARTGLPVILSTGMATLGEIEAALGVLAFGYLEPAGQPGRAAFAAAFSDPAGARILRERVTLLHCTTQYPADPVDVHLRAMDTLVAAFGLRVGYSDHTLGIPVAIGAVARGACVLEKHFTLDNTLPGPDHRASLEPPALAALVEGIRTIETALGRAAKLPTAAELGNRSAARKSLVAAKAMAAGTLWSEQTLTAKRPGSGRSPFDYWDLLGTPAERSYAADELLD